MTFGVAEWSEFSATVTGAGVNRIWEMQRGYWAFRASDEGSPAGLHAVFERETKELGEEQAGRRAAQRSGTLQIAEMVAEGRLPLWRAVTGVISNADLERMHPEERFARFAKLIRAVERVVRFEWRAFRKKRAGRGSTTGIPLSPRDRTAGRVGPLPQGERVSGAGGLASSEDAGSGVVAPSSRVPERLAASALLSERHEAGSRGEETDGGDASHVSLGRQAAGAPSVDDPRVSWWDPLRVVGEQFGLAYSALSRVCREIAGLSASDVSDRVKVETVRASMRLDVKRWLIEIYAEHPELQEMEAEEVQELVWDFLQAKRGRGKGSRASWACAHGFPSYTRFHKACLAGLGVSPIELERAVMEEVIEETEEREWAATRAEGDARSADL